MVGLEILVSTFAKGKGWADLMQSSLAGSKKQ
jgi:hypothetical protein